MAVMIKSLLCYLVLVLIRENEGARILACYPTASISHQVVFRPLTLELVKRGHEVVVMTTDPIFPKRDGPPNLKEIDLHDLSYKVWREMLARMKNKIDRSNFEPLMRLILELFEKQMATSEMQTILRDETQTFDLVIVEAFVEVALGLAEYYKAPVIQFSSLSATLPALKVYGASTHSFLYPTPFHERIYNLTFWEKIEEVYYERMFEDYDYDIFDATLKRVFGPGFKSFEELRTDVDMLFLNVHSLWDFNRPVPPNVIHLGGLHQKPQKDLPQV